MKYSLVYDLCHNHCDVIFLASNVATARLHSSLSKRRHVPSIFAQAISLTSHALGHSFWVLQRKAIFLVLLFLLDTRFETALDIVVIQIIKEAIWTHDDKVSAWLDLMLIVKCFVRKFTSCAALVREVKSVLLFFWPENLVQDKAIVFCCLCLVDHVPRVSQICRFENVRFVQGSKHSRWWSCVRVSFHSLHQDFLQSKFVSLLVVDTLNVFGKLLWEQARINAFVSPPSNTVCNSDETLWSRPSVLTALVNLIVMWNVGNSAFKADRNLLFLLDRSWWLFCTLFVAIWLRTLVIFLLGGAPQEVKMAGNSKATYRTKSKGCSCKSCTCRLESHFNYKNCAMSWLE